MMPMTFKVSSQRRENAGPGETVARLGQARDYTGLVTFTRIVVDRGVFGKGGAGVQLRE